ncbi:MAG: DUF1003 domain-containing protein [Chloroflexi bacterium]|nr:MAG: DUF1003 domain-containing protein [Chloroflexota bacterium]TMF36786.1 MAG: DUF1003 domain-containing protein [Chloroflexota bacterium]
MSIAREIEDIARDLIKHQHDHPPVRDLNRDAERRLTFADRVAADFSRLVGSWLFVLVQLAIMVVWIGLNAFNLIRPWDRYPFLFLNLILSLEAAVWVSVVLMALNRQSDRDRLRAQQDYELNVKAEEELKALMNHLMHQDEILLQIVNRLDRGDREMKRLARRLEDALEASKQAAAAQPAAAERPQISVPAP